MQETLTINAFYLVAVVLLYFLRKIGIFKTLWDVLIGLLGLLAIFLVGVIMFICMMLAGIYNLITTGDFWS